MKSDTDMRMLKIVLQRRSFKRYYATFRTCDGSNEFLPFQLIFSFAPIIHRRKETPANYDVVKVLLSRETLSYDELLLVERHEIRSVDEQRHLTFSNQVLLKFCFISYAKRASGPTFIEMRS